MRSIWRRVQGDELEDDLEDEPEDKPEGKSRAVLAAQEARVFRQGRVWRDQFLGNATIAYFGARTIVVVCS